jgi:hypothetical protein
MRLSLPGILAALAVTLGSSHAVATEPFLKVVTYSFGFLNIPTDSRSLALGQSGVADLRATNSYYNPAALSALEGIHALNAFVDWPADIEIKNFEVQFGRLFALDGGSHLRLAGTLGYKKLGQDVDPGRIIFLPNGTGRAFDVDDNHYTFGIAGGISTERFEVAMGFTTKAVSQTISSSSIDAWAFDAGATIAAKAQSGSMRVTPSLGVSVTNFGRDANFNGGVFKLPQQLRAGIALRVDGRPIRFAGNEVPMATVTVAGDLIHDDAHDDNDVGIGLEVGLADMVFVRQGYVNEMSGTAGDETTWGFGLAWAYRHVRLYFDYAHFQVSPVFEDIDAYSGGITYHF